MFYSRRRVIEAVYAGLLGRAPDAEGLRHYVERLRSGATLDNVISSMVGSLEFRRRAPAIAVSEGNPEIPSIPADLKIDEMQRSAMLDHIRAVWSRYGQTDPYFSVIASRAYHADRVDSPTIERFYKSGQRSVALMKTRLSINGLQLLANAIVIELGCGLGRIAEHLCPMVAHYIGVDISEPHLDMARARMTERGITNATFVALPEFLAGNARCDVFFSVLTLQHNPPPIALWLLEHMLKRVNSGGIAYFQAPSLIYEYVFDTVDYLSRFDQIMEMEMHPMPHRAVFEALARNGMDPIAVIQDGSIGTAGLSSTFLCSRSSQAVDPLP